VTHQAAQSERRLIDPVQSHNISPLPSSRPEYFVDAVDASRFLALHPRTVLEMARQGSIPAHPLGDGPRKTWRFLLSELDRWLRGRVHSKCSAARVITKGKDK